MSVNTWGMAGEIRVVFDGFGTKTDPEQIERELDRFLGQELARGWTVLHRQPGAALLQSQTETVSGAGMARAGGAAAGGIGIISMIGGIFLFLFGALLCLTIIGAIIGIPMIAAAVTMICGGAAAGTAGTAVGAVGLAGSASTTLYRRVSVWADESGRLYARDVC
ncbi:hypothetical protein [Streptomyces sp. NPDC051684]|uniref:hypothetical protein n=1 Tax=Streptomyces sp. NPDC051684 TaxID=3365670 RepID=UPI00379B8361